MRNEMIERIQTYRARLTERVRAHMKANPSLSEAEVGDHFRLMQEQPNGDYKGCAEVTILLRDHPQK
jgi:hypothetical protein